MVDESWYQIILVWDSWLRSQLVQILPVISVLLARNSLLCADVPLRNYSLGLSVLDVINASLPPIPVYVVFPKVLFLVPYFSSCMNE